MDQISTQSEIGNQLIDKIDTPHKNYKTQHHLKFLVVILSGATIMGAYYCFDQPVPLHDNVQSRFEDKLNVDDDEFEVYYNILYGSFAWPNIILPFFSGFIADKIGSRKVLIFLTTCAFIGSIIFYIGLMICGRAITGICLGSIFSILSYFISFYFIGGYFSVMTSVLLGLANFCDSLNVSVTPVIINNVGATVATWVPIITCGFSFVASIFLLCTDLYIEKDIKRYYLENINESQINQTNKNNSLIQLLKNIKGLPILFWLTCSYTVLSFWSILPFFGVSTEIFSTNQYNGDPDSNSKSSLAASFLWYLVLPFGSTIGYLLDKYGHRSKASIFAGILSGSANLMVFSVSPYIPIIMMSLSFSTFVSTYWSQVTYIVKKEVAASAYGLVMTGKFGGLAALTAIFGYIRSVSGSYWNSQIILSCIGFFTSVLALIIYIYDKKHNNGNLEKPKAKKKIHLTEE